MKCPKCGSEHISQERRIDGDAICMDCHHRGKPEEFRQKTNFDWITENPSTLAAKLVYPYDDEWYGRQWFGFAPNGTRLAFRTKGEAVDATVEYLKQKVKE